MSGRGKSVYGGLSPRALVPHNWLAVDIQKGRRALASYCTRDDTDSLGTAAYGRGVTAETVMELCEEGQLTEAVEALGVLVQTQCRISQSLLYTVLRKCVLKRDLVLGRRVHALNLKQGYESDTFLCNHILRMYASHARLKEAMDVFTGVSTPDAFMWSSIISSYVKHGQAKKAIHLYHEMRRSSVKPDGHVFVASLQACARAADLKTGQQVHADVLAGGLETDLFVGSCLVDMYAKCGSLEDAHRVFDGLGQKDVVTWNAIIAGCSQQGMGQKALYLYRAMQQEGFAAPDSVTFACLLQACASVGIPAMETGKQLHRQIQDKGIKVDVVVGCSLVNMYAKCGSLQDAQIVFDGLGEKDVVTWNAMIAGYSQQGMGQEALRVYNAMQEKGITAPDSVTFGCVLQACASIGHSALETGKQLHEQIREQGLQAELSLGNNLINMYAKCGSLEDAQSVFDALSQKDVVTWTALIAGYTQQGRGQEALHLYSNMQEEGIAASDCVTLMCLLQACAIVGTTALETGKQLHAEIRERGLQVDTAVGDRLVNMYAKCGSMQDARSVFDELDMKDLVTWNSMIAGYAQQCMGKEALSVYSIMKEGGTSAPDAVTFVRLLQACASMGVPSLEMGKQLHAEIEEQGLQADVFIGCSLINMYVRCGNLLGAQSVFDRLVQKDVVIWNVMLLGYSQQGMGQEALHLYSAMQEGSTVPDSVTFVCLLQACASVGSQALEMGKQIHDQIRQQGLQVDEFVTNSLINMYAKCGSFEDAQSLFDGLTKKDVVMWNAMISGYSQQGKGQEALDLYDAMQEQGISSPNSVTFVCLLQACAGVAALRAGRQLHAEIEQQGLQTDLTVANSLMNMYGKAGSMVDAQKVFDALPERDDVAWNALIVGYTRQGETEVVFNLVDRMKEDGIQPNGITFLSVLTVCSHGGLVGKGQEYFEIMSRDYDITPTAEHYACMVDLLGRAGQLDEALVLVSTMPVEPIDAVWHTLLGACRKWRNVEVGRYAFNEAMKLDQKDAAAYVSMSNIYTGAQMWVEAHEMQERRKSIGAWKQPGRSWWTDMDGLVHSFVVGDRKHSESNEIYVGLKQLLPKMMKEGYLPHLE